MRYLVTGAGGFIGRQLLPLLLARRAASVHVVLRDASPQRIARLRRLWGPNGDRVDVLSGDLGRALLGVAEADRLRLGGRITDFVHLAACYDLHARPEELHRANVEGTRHAIALAKMLGVRRFHHMSSVAVAGRYAGLWREDMFEEAGPLDHAYFATKHEAERLVRAQRALAYRIYRPSVVIGDSKSGATTKADGPYPVFRLIRKLRASIPGWMPLPVPQGGPVNLVPVDYVAAALDHLMHRRGLDGGCFHLVDPAAMDLGDALALFARVAHGPRLSLRIDPSQWDRLMALGSSLPGLQHALQPLCAALGLEPAALAFAFSPTRFDASATLAALRGSGIACPPLSAYAAAVWDYWDRHLEPEDWPHADLAQQVAGRVALVTGGSSGIGLASALRLADAGAFTVICARDTDRLAQAQAQGRSRGLSLETHRTDLTDPSQVNALVSALHKRHGGVDILVNNAGHSIRRGVLDSLDRLHDFERCMQLNYFGALRLTMALLPGMIARGGGHVVNLSSIGVLTHAPRFSAYLASKAALDAWTASAACELADQGVHFSTVNMPLVRTPMIAPTHAYDDAPALSPQEAAELVVRAIVGQGPRVATGLGVAGQLLHALAPGLAQQLMIHIHRLFPDPPVVGSAGGPQDLRNVGAGMLNPEDALLRLLLRGLHF